MTTILYMNVKTAAQKWNLTERRVRILCSEGRVDGVIRNGWAWNIPFGAPKPKDGRQLRHIKNYDMRPGASNYAVLDSLKADFAKRKDDSGYILGTYRSLIRDFLSGAFAFEGEILTPMDLSSLFEGKIVGSLSFEHQLLALNCRSILLRMIQETGPGFPSMNLYFSERKLKTLYCTMLQGIDDLTLGEYRKASIPAGGALDCKIFSIDQQMSILLYQYEKEWGMLHPLVRSVFLFGELMRIRPFGRYDVLFALVVLNCELIAGGYSLAVIDSSQIDECKADLSLTQKRGNYQALIGLVEQSLVHSFSVLLQKEKKDDV